MNNLPSHASVTMSSREIASLTGKAHGHVMRDIKKMLTDLEIDQSTNGGIFLDDYGRKQPMFNLSRELTDCLLTGYSAKMRMAVIKRWHELEASEPAPKFALPATMAEALRLAADQAEQLEIAAPKVAFVDKYVAAEGNKGFRETAKLLSINEGEFRAFLMDNNIVYRLGGSLAGYAQHIDAGRIATKAVIDSTGKARNQALFTPKGVEWIAGLIAKHKVKQSI